MHILTQIHVYRPTFLFGSYLMLLKEILLKQKSYNAVFCFIFFCFFLSQHVFTMDPTNVENGRGKVPHDPSLPFASTFNGKSSVVLPSYDTVHYGVNMKITLK